MTASPSSYVDWYKDQVVLLTGATGSLGGCMLYKLTVQLPTAKVYALCRRSTNDAIQKWEASMPEQIDEIMDSGKLHCVLGDIASEGFGLSPVELELLQQEVTVAIHAAANISLAQHLPGSILDDCLPAINVARVVRGFSKVQRFLHVSSMFAQTHLPAGMIAEQIVKMDAHEPAPETQIAAILATGQSPYAHRFITPYAQAKYLAEQLLSKFDANYPILIVRPTSVAPAIRDPYPLYGPDGAIPLHTFLDATLERGYDVSEIIGGLQQDMVFDEIPVDLVANTCLLHIASGTSGIVHAAAQLHVPLTIAEFSAKAQFYATEVVMDRIMSATAGEGGRRRELPLQFHELFSHEWRDWIVDCTSSETLRRVSGPIGIDIPHDFDDYFRARVEKWCRGFMTRLGQ